MESILDPRFKDRKLIGVGGFGEIYKAKDQRLNTLVAIKMIDRPLGDDRKFLDMLRDEAILTRQLEDHPNIVKIYDLLEAPGQLAIVMQYIDGVNLGKFIKNFHAGNRNQPVPLKIALHIIGEVCLALNHAHNAKNKMTGAPLQIVHRDVSPSNIMITFDGEVKVIDFGIAKAEFDARITRTATGVLKGKVPYMTPEHGGSKMDGRSDIYSLGAVLYETLTGTQLFSNSNLSQQLLDAQNANILPDKFENDRISPEIKRIIKKAVKKELDKRYQSALAMYQDLETYLQRLNAKPADLKRELSEIMGKFPAAAPEESVPEDIPPTKDLPFEDKQAESTVTIGADEPKLHPARDDESGETPIFIPPETKPPKLESKKKAVAVLTPRNVLAAAALVLLAFVIARFVVNGAISPAVKFQIAANLDSALVLVNGKPYGKTPAEFSWKPDTAFALALYSEGYDTVKGFSYLGNGKFANQDVWQYERQQDSSWLVTGNFSRNVIFATTPKRVRARVLVDNDTVSAGLVNEDAIRLFAGNRRITLRPIVKGYADTSFILAVDAKLGNSIPIKFRSKTVNPPPLIVAVQNARTKAALKAYVVIGTKFLPTPASIKLQNRASTLKVVAEGYMDKTINIPPSDTSGQVVVALDEQPTEGVRIEVKDKKTELPILEGRILLCRKNKIEDCRQAGEGGGFVGELFGNLDAYGSHTRRESGKYFFKIDCGSKYKPCITSAAIQVRNGSVIVFELVRQNEDGICSQVIR